ncbi:DUF2239 family protein [Dyella flagellata]|uniref:DUF2239 domain-containing protein n=1 Tax=Dyella flagellata TaxID=1867833 RepID=A0ABQ5XGS3_9GAMM|nr:DUF2239 family protein [Dyella flagellata]GLQ89644.1 hypothetical protein GCM10007898_32190 [Dyella flagellata]
MSSPAPSVSYTSFQGDRRLASGPLHVVALAVKLAAERANAKPILIFDDGTGRSIDVDMRGSDEEVLARYFPVAAVEEDKPDAGPDAPRGRGRPKLGVIAREVTLLPRHWEWLAAQPGGPSVALRKLVDEARRTHGERDKARARQERAYHFMSAMAGDRPAFEEATRALFANDAAKFGELIAAWPGDVRDYAAQLAFTE